MLSQDYVSYNLISIRSLVNPPPLLTTALVLLSLVWIYKFLTVVHKCHQLVSLQVTITILTPPPLLMQWVEVEVLSILSQGLPPLVAVVDKIAPVNLSFLFLVRLLVDSLGEVGKDSEI